MLIVRQFINSHLFKKIMDKLSFQSSHLILSKW